MQGTEIFGPFFGMILLTFVVWTVMYVRRLGFIARYKIDTEKLKRPDQGAALVPDAVAYSSYNFKNLFELPILFYALCVYLFVTGNVDSVYLTSAWIFLMFRSVHSVIHCTVNIVKIRLLSYLVASFALWFMVLRAILDFLGVLNT
jgi:hypothetical protein